MLNVEINLPPGIIGIEHAVAASLPEIAKAVRNDISTQATRGLTTSLLEYRTGLKISNFAVSAARLKSGGAFRFAVISLSGWLANAVESGWEGGNMVGWLVQGRNVEPPGGKRGKYATIRFRHTLPGTTGAVGTVMGALEHTHGGLSRQAAHIIGKKIARHAKKNLTPNATAPPMGSHMSRRLSSSVATALGGRTMRGSAPGAARHSGPVQGGLTKRVDSAGTTYETYRRASVNVPGKWIHPGISAHNFFGKAVQRFPAHARMVIDRHVSGLGDP